MSEKAENQESVGEVIIKRYGNRRLYNTETKSYVTYQDLIAIIRAGHDVKVIDSSSKTDVTKAVLMQAIVEEEKSNRHLLPLSFLFQLIRSQEATTQDFFANYLSSSFDAYMKTREEFDRRFKGWLELTSNAPQLWEKFIPGADALRDILAPRKKDES